MKETVGKKTSTRNLDDVTHSNIVVTRQIKRMVRKFPSMSEMDIDCWVSCGHYTMFKYKDGKFVWSTDKPLDCVKGFEAVTNDSDLINKDDLNKLIVSTYRTMCDSQNYTDIIDTPEDLLAYAETKLKEMLREDTVVYLDDSN